MRECKHDGGFDIGKTKDGKIVDVMCSDCGTPLMMIISDQQDRIEELETAAMDVGKVLRKTDPLTVPIKISAAIISLVGVAEGAAESESKGKSLGKIGESI